MKKLVVILLVTALAITCLVGCGSLQEQGGTTPESSEESSAPVETGEESAEVSGAKVVLSNAFYTAPYCAAFNPAAEAKAAELGIELQILDGETNQQKQLEQAKLAMTDADAFIYFPADIEGAGAVIEALNNGGFPYLLVNNYDTSKLEEMQVPCYVGAELKQHGYNMFEMLTQIFPEKKAKLVAIEGTAGHGQTVAFNEAFDEMFAGAEFEWLDRQNADFDADKAMTKMTDMLTKYGDEIEGIVCHDGGMLQGVMAALKSANKLGDIPIVCAGSNQNIHDAIEEGYVYGTSTQDPGMEAELAIETIIKIMNGETVDQWEKVPCEICTKDNLDDYSWF